MTRHMVLQRRSPDGSILWEHCAVVENRTGKWPEQYPQPDIPEDGVDLWEWYWQLRNAASFGASGPNPLAYTEMQAWSHLFQIHLSALDIRLLMVLDQQYLVGWYENQKAAQPKK